MSVLLDPLVEPLRYIYHIIKYKEYRQYIKLISKYGDSKRYNVCEVKFDQHKFMVPDVASFLSTYKELFVKNIYKFHPRNKKINIIDFGANIGLSVLFFLKNYPEAHIAAYEADPYIYGFLEKNINNISGGNVSLYNNAVWNKIERLNFFSEGADGGRIDLNSQSRGSAVEVQAIDANSILAKYLYVDFLKIDIEGAETVVLPHIKNQLYKVENIFVEYHSEIGKKQGLKDIIDTLEETGFRIYIQNVSCAEKPFIEKNLFSGFDLQINIFGVRT